VITETLQAMGQWSVRLRGNTPKSILDVLDANYFGHVAILPGRVDVNALGDSLLPAARYVGVYRQKFNQQDEFEIQGNGLAFWLGDSDDRGDIFVTAKTFAASTFAPTVRALLPASGSVVEGTLYSIGGSATFSGTVQWETPRAALNRVATAFTASSTDPVEWRINNDATLDMGKVSQLYPSALSPKAILVKKGAADRDMSTVTVQANLSLDADVEDYATAVYVIGQGDGAAAPVGSASAAPTNYKHLRGGNVVVAQVLSDTSATAAEATISAGLALADTQTLRRAAQISTEDYDIKGTFGSGDSVYVFDPDAGFIDLNNEVMWQGRPINPMKLRVSELSWPVPLYWTVAFRDKNGLWYDLSGHYAAESGNASIVVGEFNQRLTGGLGPDLDGRATPDSSIPAAPVFGTFYTGTYESGTQEGTRAQIQAQWNKPLNTDGSTLIDLDHYELQFRPNTRIAYPATHAAMSAFRYNQLLTHGQPLVPPFTSGGEWQTNIIGPDVTVAMVQELLPGVQYEFRIRAVDNASPPNVGAWSLISAFTAARDTKAPDQPAPPSVAASRNAVQVIHSLGSNAGGTFNLARDLDHLEVYLGGSADFECIPGNRLGKLIANAGMMQGNIAAVGTFPIEPVSQVFIKVAAVDKAGNRSAPSRAASVTALLIDDAHISDLTVSKVTAGTITATWVMAGTFTTALTGARTGMDSAGFFAYNPAGGKTFEVDSTTGTVTTTGVFQTGKSGQRIVINDAEPYASIYMHGSREANNPASLSGVDYVRNSINYTGFQANGSTFIESDGIPSKAWLFMSDFTSLGLVDPVTNASRGGQFYTDFEQAKVTHNRTDAVPVSGEVLITSTFSHISFNKKSADVGDDQKWFMNKDSTAHFGTWDDYVDRGANAGLFTGTVAGTDNATSISLGYGTTAASQRPCLYTIRDTHTTPVGHEMQANDTSGFTVALSAAAAGGWSIYFWAFRI